MSEEKDLQQFEKLYAEWVKARNEAEEAQNTLDTMFRKSLTEQTLAPNLRMQEKVDDLWYCEAEKRGNLDEFISERFS